MNFIAIIPAKKNSFRVKNKNLRKFKKKSLLQYTIDQAKKSKLLDKIYVSSDSKKILEIAKKNNLSVTGIRSKKFSGRKTSMHSVIKYETKKIKDKFDYLVILQPTSPLRSSKDIDESCKLIKKNKNAHCLVSCSKLPNEFIPKKLMVNNGKFLNFFDFNSIFLNNVLIKKTIKYNFLNSLKKKNNHKKYFFRNGSIYITRKNKINHYLIGGNILCYEMPISRSLDINTEADFKKLYLI